MVKKPSSIPRSPGVYFFKKGSTILYAGKANNLGARLASYFRARVSEKVQALRTEATRVEWKKTASEIEALLAEAEMIKRHIPKYNVLLRDDKNYAYVACTHEAFPRMFITHQPPAPTMTYTHHARTGVKKAPISSLIGPFTSAHTLRIVLIHLRRIFPYCTCSSLHTRPCVSAQMGRCPGYCCRKDVTERSDYAALTQTYGHAIGAIKAILTGKKKTISKELTKEMHSASRRLDFELASRLRNQREDMQHIFSHRIYVGEKTYGRNARTSSSLASAWRSIEKNLAVLLGNTDTRISRVEGYDISNISGTSATGSMVVFSHGVPEKSAYRMFKIKMPNIPNDVAMHQEVLRRRLRHHEWTFPDLILIDGGKPQLSAALGVITHVRPELKSRVVALAKREEELFFPARPQPIRLKDLPPPTAFFLQRVRDESHRFAKRYHHKRRELFFRNEAR